MPVFALNGLFIYLFIYLFFLGGGRGGQLPFPSLLLPLLVHLCSSRQGITTGTCKTKAILADLDIFRHNQPYSRTSQLYLDIFRTLCNCALWNECHDFFNTPHDTGRKLNKQTFTRRSIYVLCPGCRSELNAKKYWYRESREYWYTLKFC